MDKKNSPSPPPLSSYHNKKNLLPTEDCPTWMEGYDMKKTLQAAAMAAECSAWTVEAQRPRRLPSA